MTAPRVLVAAPTVPEWDRESGWQRLLDIIEFLRGSGAAVSFVARDGVRFDRYARGLNDLGVPTYPGDTASVEALVANERFDLAILAFWYVAESYLPIIRSRSPHTRVIVDTVDLHFLRNARKLLSVKGAGGEALLDPGYGVKMSRELNAYVQCDGVFAVSKKEANLVDDLAGEPGLSFVVPDAVTLSRTTQTFDRRSGIVFIGNFRHDPNVQAVSFLVDDVLPHLDRALLDEHRIDVVGNAIERAEAALVKAGPNVRAIGWVPSVVPYIERARVSVIPVRFGAGTKRKLLQSLAAGTPAVSTTVGAEGLGLDDRVHFLLANDPAEFARAVTRLLTDRRLWGRISGSGRAFVDARFDRDGARTRLLEAISVVSERSPKPLRRTPSAPVRIDPKVADYEGLVTRIRERVTGTIPDGSRILVISKGDARLVRFDGRVAGHFPQTEDGVYAGHHPSDSDSAIRQLEALQRTGSAHLVIPSTAFWWLEHYQGFAKHLAVHYHRVSSDADCIIFAANGNPVPDLPATTAAFDREGSSSQEPAPIIVFGAPRSGTTYLARILNEQPEVFITHETRLFVWMHRSLNVLTQDDEALLGERPAFIDHLTESYPQLVREFYRKLRPGARYWGDKNPHYSSPNHVGCLESIDHLFPGARFIQIIRDGRDVVASLIRKRHPDGRPWIDFAGAHHVWTSHIDIGCAFGRGLQADRYLELRYEDLINDDEKWAISIFEFLGIPVSSSVLDFCRAQQGARTPLSEPTRDISGGVAHSDWSSVLSARQQRQSLQLIGPHLVRYGYADEEELRPPKRRPSERSVDAARKNGSKARSRTGSDPARASDTTPTPRRSSSARARSRAQTGK